MVTTELYKKVCAERDELLQALRDIRSSSPYADDPWAMAAEAIDKHVKGKDSE